MEPIIIKQIDSTIRVGYSGKQLGNTSAQFGHTADKNFAKFTAKFPGKTVYNMPAVGKDNTIDIDDLSPEQILGMEADALITKNPSNLLTLKAADCIPVAFFVPGKKILCLAHVGASGAALHLPARIIEKLSVEPEAIHCYIGPSISQKSYRFVDEDLTKKKLDSSWASYIMNESDGIHINLLGYVLDELKKSGVQRENVELSNIDTGADPDYFSHRRHKLTGEPDGRNTFGVCLT